MLDRGKAENQAMVAKRAAMPQIVVPDIEGVPAKDGAQHSRDLGSGSDLHAVGTPGLEVHFDAALKKMIAASGGLITIGSGRRSPEEQQKLWQNALAKYGDPEIADNYVARPGTSHHESGTAADLHYSSDAAKQWAHQHAAEYGLRFPMGHEPWHIEPVR